MAIPAVLIGAVAKSAGMLCPKFNYFARETDWVPGTPGALHDKGRGNAWIIRAGKIREVYSFYRGMRALLLLPPPLLR